MYGSPVIAAAAGACFVPPPGVFYPVASDAGCRCLLQAPVDVDALSVVDVYRFVSVQFGSPAAVEQVVVLLVVVGRPGCRFGRCSTCHGSMTRWKLSTGGHLQLCQAWPLCSG